MRCLSVCLSVYVLDTLVSPANMVAPIGMPFGLLTCVGPRNHVLERFGSPTGRENFGDVPAH